MIVSKVAIGAGVAVLGLLCWLAAAGVTAVTVILVTGASLLLLVGGGNWLGGRGSPRTAPGPAPATPPGARGPVPGPVAERGAAVGDDPAAGGDVR